MDIDWLTWANFAIQFVWPRLTLFDLCDARFRSEYLSTGRDFFVMSKQGAHSVLSAFIESVKAGKALFSFSSGGTLGRVGGSLLRRGRAMVDSWLGTQYIA